MEAANLPADIGASVATRHAAFALTVSVGNCAPPPMRGRVTSGLGVTNYLGQFSSAYMAAPLVIIFGLAGLFL